MPHYERFKHRPRPRLSHGVHEHFPRGRTYFGRATGKGKGGVLLRNIVIIGAIVGVIYIAKNGGREIVGRFITKPAAERTETKIDPKAKKLEDALKNFLADVQTPPARELTVVTKVDDDDAGKEHITKREKPVREEKDDAVKTDRTAKAEVPEKKAVETKPRREAKTASRTAKGEAKPKERTAERTAESDTSVKKRTETVARAEAPVKAVKPSIYFIKYDEDKGNIELAPRKRPLGYKPTIKDAITALLDGPDNRERDGNIITCIPEKAYLIDAKQEGDTVFLDFNAEFEYNRLGYEGLRAQVNQIVFTATQFSGIKSVVFLINGKRRDSIGGEGFSIAKPFTRSGSALTVN